MPKMMLKIILWIPQHSSFASYILIRIYSLFNVIFIFNNFVIFNNLERKNTVLETMFLDISDFACRLCVTIFYKSVLLCTTQIV